MIDIWLIFCLLVPFAFTLIQTAIECYREEDVEKPPEKWAEVRDDRKVVFGNKQTIIFKLFHVFTVREKFIMGTALVIACQKQRWNWQEMGK